MDDISFKDIRVLGSQLDLKGNGKKTLPEIFGQLQTGSFLKATITENAENGKVILSTSFGNFIVPNELDLNKGDLVNIRLDLNNEKPKGEIIAVNNKPIAPSSAVQIELVKYNKTNNPVDITARVATNVDLSQSNSLPNLISGNITYLNVSKLDNTSLIFRALANFSHVDHPIPIKLNAVTSSNQNPSPFLINGEVMANNQENQQLIKTNFGIITTENTKMPIGQKLIFEMTNLNNKDIKNNVSKDISELMFKISKNWPLLKNLTISPLKTSANFQEQATSLLQEQQIIEKQLSLPSINALRASGITANLQVQSQVLNKQTDITNINIVKPIGAQEQQAKEILNPMLNPDLFLQEAAKFINIPAKLNIKKPGINKNNSDSYSKNPNDQNMESPKNISLTNRQSHLSLNKIINNIQDKEIIKNLSSELANIKELITANVIDSETLNKWYNVSIPFYNGKEIEERELNFTRPQEHFLRFTFNIKLDLIGNLELDGLIRFDHGNKTPKGFDLIMRSSNNLEKTLQNRISEIFKIHQEITGIGGSMSFQEGTIK